MGAYERLLRSEGREHVELNFAASIHSDLCSLSIQSFVRTSLRSPFARFGAFEFFYTFFSRMHPSESPQPASRPALRRRTPRSPSAKSPAQQQRSSAPRARKSRISHAYASPSYLTHLVVALSLTPFFTVLVLLFMSLRIRNPPASIPDHSDLQYASQHLSAIAAQKRYVGTRALQNSFSYVTHHIKRLVPIAASNHMALEVHVFRAKPSSYAIEFASTSFINSYDNVTTVVARLRPSHLPANSPQKSLLINTHIDSAIESPGASDNVASVAVALDLIRSLANMPPSENVLSRPIIFLFNGAEETILMGAHSFVTQHPWASSVQAHINLESIGSGDSYYLFRLGRHNPWLAYVFANAVSIPSTSVAASDLFSSHVSYSNIRIPHFCFPPFTLLTMLYLFSSSSQLIPAETDFRVFDEWANIPGYDFALLDNGYLYHTQKDNIRNVDRAGMRHGSIIFRQLALELAGTRDAIGAFRKGKHSVSRIDYICNYILTYLPSFVPRIQQPDIKVTYFDVLNSFTIVYSSQSAYLITAFVIFTTVLIWAAKCANMNKAELSGCLRMFFIVIATIPACFASASVTSFVYSSIFNAKLRWYGSWIKASVMYVPPSFFGALTILLELLPRRLSAKRYDQMLFATTVVYVTLTCLFMKLGIMAGYIPLVFLITANLVAIQGSMVHPILRQFQMTLIYAVLVAKQMKYIMTVALPLLGRAKTGIVPPDTIAAMIVCFLFMIYWIWLSLPILCQYAHALRKVRKITFAVCLGTGAWAILNSLDILGGTYSIYSEKAPKRIFVLHFYSPHMEPNSVLALTSLDPINLDTERIVNGLTEKEPGLETYPSVPTFGKMEITPFESFRPFRKFFNIGQVFKTANRPRLSLPDIQIVSEEKIGREWNVTVSVNAPGSHSISLRMKAEDTIEGFTSWSFDSAPNYKKDGRWINHAGSRNMSFWLVVKEDAKNPGKRCKVILSAASARLGKSKSPEVLTKLKFESWESAALVVATAVEVEM